MPDSKPPMLLSEPAPPDAAPDFAPAMMPAREMALLVVRAAGPGDRWSITHEPSGKMCTASVKSYAISLARNWARRARPSRLVVMGADGSVESEDEYGPQEGSPPGVVKVD